MEKIISGVSILALSIFLTGCNSLGSVFGNERYAGSVIEPGERLVIKSRRNKNQNQSEELVCAEPPPDVATSVFSAITASLKAEVDGEASAGVDLSSISDTNFLKLFERSQGIQGLRDGMYRSCEAFLNGGINQETYGQQMTYMTATLNFLVTIELCGKILDTKELTVKEANSKVDFLKDLRPDLYQECLSTAREFAQGILRSSTDFQKESLKYNK